MKKRFKKRSKLSISARKKKINRDLKKAYMKESTLKKNLEDITSSEGKINYIKLVIKNKDILKARTFKWLNEYLADLEIEDGNTLEAARAFKNAKDKEMAKECNRANRTFTKKDEETLRLLEEELNKINKG